MAVIEIFFEAKCKHCRLHEVIDRRTYCTKHLEDKSWGNVKKNGKPIRLKDKACPSLTIG